MPATPPPPPPPSTSSVKPTDGMQNGGKRSAWMTHVKKTMRAHKGMKLAQVLKMAKKTYKKTARGGSKSGVAAAAGSLTGGRRHRRGKSSSRKH